MRAVLSSLLLSAVLAAAQQPAKPVGPTPDEPRTGIEGRVLTTAGEPVPHATLRLIRTANPLRILTAETDGQGHFTADLSQGGYSLSAAKTGFVRDDYDEILILNPGDVRTIDFHLAPDAVVSGQVVNPEGDPVQGMQVQIRSYLYVRGVRQATVKGEVDTDDRGRFRIAGLAPGRYYMTAGENQWRALDLRREIREPETLVTTYWPGVIDPAAATPFTIAAGANVDGLKFEMRRARIYKIQVTAVDQAGDPVPSAALTIRAADESMFTNVGSVQPVRSTNGVFEFRHLLPGT